MIKAGDTVTLRADRAFVSEVLLDPREGYKLVFVVPSRWGTVPPTRDGIIGLDMDNLEVVETTLASPNG